MKRPVVLVFDDDLVRHPEFLGRCSARFIYRPHADDAVAAVAAVAPDLVVMDYSMGADLSGAEAVTGPRAEFGGCVFGSVRTFSVEKDRKIASAKKRLIQTVLDRGQNINFNSYAAFSRGWKRNKQFEGHHV